MKKGLSVRFYFHVSKRVQSIQALVGASYCMTRQVSFMKIILSTKCHLEIDAGQFGIDFFFFAFVVLQF